jgi:hypothetical protein
MFDMATLAFSIALSQKGMAFVTAVTFSQPLRKRLGFHLCLEGNVRRPVSCFTTSKKLLESL